MRLLCSIIQKRFSGHSKWSTIKRDKTANDVTRSKKFMKLCNQITNAARTSGSLPPKYNTDPATNLTLSSALSVAKQNQVPKLRIEASIKNASNEKSEVALVGGVYEVMCKGGIAMIVECLTNSKNRLAQELKHNLTKRNAVLSANVMYLFTRKGRIVVSSGASKLGINEIVEKIIESCDAVEDMKCVFVGDFDCVEIVTSVKETIKCRVELEVLGLEIQSVELYYDSKDKVVADEESGFMFGDVLAYLEDNDDVIQVHHNCNE